MSARFFDVLGVHAIAGRIFLDSDDHSGSDALVLSEALWRSRFGAGPLLVGQTTRLGGRAFTIVGIVPADFRFDIPGTTSAGASVFWTLLDTPRDRSPAQRYPHYLQVIGRLKRGVSIEAARDDIAAVSDAIAPEMPDTNQGHRATAEPLRARIIPSELRLMALALAFAQSVAAFLFDVEPRDPVTFGVVTAVLVMRAIGACVVPAMRAVQVDPVEAFRRE